MKYILLFLFILCSSYSCIAQQSFSLQIGTDIGLLQVQRNELMMLQDRNKYNSRIAPFIEAEYRIPKSKLIVGSILRYSFSDIVIFIGGNPWFANDNEGFPKIHLKNEHIEGTL